MGLVSVEDGVEAGEVEAACGGGVGGIELDVDELPDTGLFGGRLFTHVDGLTVDAGGLVTAGLLVEELLVLLLIIFISYRRISISPVSPRLPSSLKEQDPLLPDAPRFRTSRSTVPW